jgi:hypothetical protein
LSPDTHTRAQVVRFIILLAQAVPISLYVSLESVKVAQCKVPPSRAPAGATSAV